MTYQRWRIWFGKAGSLRYISHRDLVRTLERVFRRAGLPLRMSQGFHPKARMSFPLALAVGIASEEEVMEVELEGTIADGELQQRLRAQLPDGLTLRRLVNLPEGTPKAQVARVTYALTLDGAERDRVQRAVDSLRQQTSYWIARDGRDEPLDLWADLERIEVTADTVMIVQRVTRTATVQPREILVALDVADPDRALFRLTRTQVELVA